jgi:hypothetical protein
MECRYWIAVNVCLRMAEERACKKSCLKTLEHLEIDRKKQTHLDTDGTDDANLIALNCAHIFRCMVLFRVSVIKF